MTHKARATLHWGRAGGLALVNKPTSSDSACSIAGRKEFKHFAKRFFCNQNGSEKGLWSKVLQHQYEYPAISVCYEHPLAGIALNRWQILTIHTSHAKLRASHAFFNVQIMGRMFP